MRTSIIIPLKPKLKNDEYLNGILLTFTEANSSESAISVKYISLLYFEKFIIVELLLSPYILVRLLRVLHSAKVDKDLIPLFRYKSEVVKV